MTLISSWERGKEADDGDRRLQASSRGAARQPPFSPTGHLYQDMPEELPITIHFCKSLYVCCNRGRCSVTVIVNGNSSAPIIPVPVTTDDCAMSSMGWIAGSSRIGNGMSTYWH
ncbi:hypothetical protein FOZ62_000273, partial [Perkinsus olseni]